MRIVLMSIIIAIMSVTSFAQGSSPVKVGGNQLNFGIGGAKDGIPAYINYEWCLWQDITLGPVAKVYIGDVVALGFAGRGDYHFNTLIGIPENFDFYAGLNVGVGGIVLSGEGSDVGVGFDWGLQIGGRWYWSESWGLNVEFGGGNGYGGTLGVSLKI